LAGSRVRNSDIVYTIPSCVTMGFLPSNPSKQNDCFVSKA